MTTQPEPQVPRTSTRIPPDPGAAQRAQTIVILLAVALAVGTLGYRAVMEAGLDQTAALFVGLPAVLAIAVAKTPPAKTVTGLILKVMTLGLLLGGILLGETLVCLVVAAPLVYLIGTAIGIPIDMSRRRRARGQHSGPPLMVVGIVLLSSFEGVVPALEMDNAGAVTVVQHVAADPAAVEDALAATPQFEGPLPAPLRLGFPRPIAASGSGLSVGDRRWVTFKGDAHYGATHIGTVEFLVAVREPGRVVFTTVDDNSRVAQWLTWQRADVTWRAHEGGTLVSWTLHYERRLSPSWYFTPVQAGAARLAAGYLIDSLATPHE